MKKIIKGFTLIELMVIVIIIAILIAIAYPLYLSQVRKARRSAGISTLMAMQIAEEKYRHSNVQYGDLTQVWDGITKSDDGYYDLTITNAGPTSYTLTATATGDQVNDKQGGVTCSPLELAVNNGTETKTPTECWK